MGQDELAFPTLAGRTEPQAIFDEAVRLAAQIAGANARAVYLVVRGDIATVIAEFDPSGGHAPPFVWLHQHHALAEVVRTGAPVGVTFSDATVAPPVRAALGRMQVTGGAAVPVFAWGSLHGVLAVGSRTGKIHGDGALLDLARAVEAALDPAGGATSQQAGRHSTKSGQAGGT